jgi:hypothetical protein
MFLATEIKVQKTMKKDFIGHNTTCIDMNDYKVISHLFSIVIVNSHYSKISL